MTRWSRNLKKNTNWRCSISVTERLSLTTMCVLALNNKPIGTKQYRQTTYLCFYLSAYRPILTNSRNTIARWKFLIIVHTRSTSFSSKQQQNQNLFWIVFNFRDTIMFLKKIPTICWKKHNCCKNFDFVEKKNRFSVLFQFCRLRMDPA